MFPYLGFCRVFSFLFFFCYLASIIKKVDKKMHILFPIRLRLITIFFLMDKSTALGIHLTRLNIPWSANSFKGEAFYFLSVFSALYDFGIWVSSLSQIMCLHFPMNKGQLVSFHSLKNDHMLLSASFH